MPRQIITTANAPSSPPYSHAVKAGPHVLVSGTAGIDPATGSLAGDTIRWGRGMAGRDHASLSDEPWHGSQRFSRDDGSGLGRPAVGDCL
jgi:hypothetical protein